MVWIVIIVMIIIIALIVKNQNLQEHNDILVSNNRYRDYEQKYSKYNKEEVWEEINKIHSEYFSSYHPDEKVPINDPYFKPENTEESILYSRYLLLYDRLEQIDEE